MKVIKAFGATALITPMPESELRSLRGPLIKFAPKLRSQVLSGTSCQYQIKAHRTKLSEDLWSTVGPGLHASFKGWQQHRPFIAKGGLGRTVDDSCSAFEESGGGP